MRDGLRAILSVVIAVVGACCWNIAAAQPYPTKLIRFVVPNSAGALLDIVARILTPDMAKFLGQPVIVENKPGADNIIGLEYVARQMPADGYTVTFMTVSGLATLPLTVKELRFDPLKDLPPVINLGEGRWVFGSSARQPWKSFSELVSYTKQNPGKLNYGSPIPSMRLIADVFLRDLGLEAVHIPYASAGGYFKAMIADEIHMGFVTEAQSIAYGDKFRALAITGTNRRTRIANVPTLGELGYPQIPGFNFSLNVRAGTPRAVVDKLNSAAVWALQQPDVKARFANIHLENLGNNTPEDAAAILANEVKLFGDIARLAGIRPQ